MYTEIGKRHKQWIIWRTSNSMGRKWHYLGLILVAIIWGSNFGISKLAMDSFHPIVFTFLRFGLAAPIFFILLKWREGSVRVERRHIPKLIIVSIVGIAVLELLVVYSIKLTTLANASLLNVAPWPIFVALLAPLFIKEQLTKRIVVGGCLALVGVSFVILGGTEGINLSTEHMIGNLLAFLVSILGALYNLMSMSLMKHYSALRVSTWTIGIGSLVIFPFTLRYWSETEWSSLGSGQYIAIAFNVLICTVLAFIVWNACMFKVGATKANFFRYLVPLTATLMGYVLFQESITAIQIVGTLLMAFGLVWISLEKKKEDAVLQ